MGGETDLIPTMSGFLDANAPSVDVEYSRYLDGDILGKLIAKNFLRNRIGYQHDHIVIPVGRHGDARSKYAQAGKVDRDAADGRVKTKKGDVTVEIKCARINIANQCNGRELENWAFGDILLSPTKKQKKYDVLIAIGLRTLGLENGRY